MLDIDGPSSRVEGLFGGRIKFGTAGLRAAMGPGPMLMNRAVVRHAAAGVASELTANVADARRRGVVVGHDARHLSEAFASDVVEVMMAHGLDVHAFVDLCPTPLVAFAVRQLQAAAGIMITASHNPAGDNGMKVYWEDGAQIIPPLDDRIAERIAAVTEESLACGVDVTTAPNSTDRVARLHQLGGPDSDDPLIVEYLREALRLLPADRRRPNPSVRIAATPLHGVGGLLLERLLGEAGYDDVELVRSQRLPDPDFPTVSFPNPEEPGTLDQLLELADSMNADVALANDPDADRMAAAFVDPGGAWRVLRGDELGALLTHRLLELTDEEPRRLLATTVVSSRLTARMADAADVEFHETLTGFKWLCRPGLTDPTLHQVLLYEEALGYAVGPDARDKDGITAALVLVDMVRHLKSSGTTVWDVLDGLAVRFGAHVQRNSSIRVSGSDGSTRIAAIVDKLTSSPLESIGGHDVIRADRPAPDVFRYFLADDSRVVVRPSGTEPKVKLYCEAVEAVVGPDVDRARAVADERLEHIEGDLRRLVGHLG